MDRDERIGKSWTQERRTKKRAMKNVKLTVTDHQFLMMEIECPSCYWTVSSTAEAVNDRTVYQCPNCAAMSFVRKPKRP